jgi:hypothetical protein
MGTETSTSIIDEPLDIGDRQKVDEIDRRDPHAMEVQRISRNAAPAWSRRAE